MKICIIDPVGNLGGGSRFLRCLVPALKDRRASLRLALLAPRVLLARENWSAVAGACEMELHELRSTRLTQEGIAGLADSASMVRYLQGRFRSQIRHFPDQISGDVQREIQRKSSGADVVLFPWPFLFALPSLDCPAAAVFHDFNFKYFFGSFPAFFPWQREQIERDMPAWLWGTYPVVSSDFMANELARFYPGCPRQPEVIRVPPMLPAVVHMKQALPEVSTLLGTKAPYVLYPCSLHAHKNIGPLITAMALLAEQGLAINLVLTGPQTELVRGTASSIGLIQGADHPNVFGVGYVSNPVMEALLESATAVISSSLYEAGNGPGLEGWIKGRPVVMSDIPSFVEHMRVWGVYAEIFDPRSPDSIARALAKVLRNPEQARLRAELSRERMAAYTWGHAADQYLNLFDRMTKEAAR
jgi:glycosyltransferase involved in cell wall biosynthesis